MSRCRSSLFFFLLREPGYQVAVPSVRLWDVFTSQVDDRVFSYFLFFYHGIGRWWSIMDGKGQCFQFSVVWTDVTRARSMTG